MEYAWVAPELEQATRALELRPIAGYRGSQWLLAANPILGWALNGPGRSGKPDFNPAFKLARTLGIGRGLTGATDRWTLKAIFDVPFD